MFDWLRKLVKREDGAHVPAADAEGDEEPEAPVKKRRTRGPVRYRWYLGGAAVICLLLSSFIEHQAGVTAGQSWLRDPATWESLAREVGFALIIALATIVTVEELSKRLQRIEAKEERDQLKKDVFAAVFGISLPKNVLDAVNRKILSQKFYRTNSTCHYELIPQEFETTGGGKKKGVTLRSHCSFTVKNMSQKKEVFRFSVFAEKPQLSDLKDPIKQVHVEGISIDGVSLTKEEIEQADKDAPDDSAKRLLRDIEMNPGEETVINFSFSVVRGYDDSELWITLLPNDGMKLSLQVPPSFKAFSAVAIDAADLVLTHSSESSGYYSWELRDTVLPYQGILLWWRLTDWNVPSNVSTAT